MEPNTRFELMTTRSGAELRSLNGLNPPGAPKSIVFLKNDLKIFFQQ